MRTWLILPCSLLACAFPVSAQPPDLLLSPFSEDVAHQSQEEWAEHLGAPVVIENSIGMKLVLIPPGEFMMGSDQPAAEVGGIFGPESFNQEHPQHRVRITKPMYVGVYEVTQSQWESLTGSNPSQFAPGGAEEEKIEGLDTSEFPVENINWYEAVRFCNLLSAAENLPEYYDMQRVMRSEYTGEIRRAIVEISGGPGYRLPTEAEWEYCCRAGTTTTFSFGASSNGEQANLPGSYPDRDGERAPILRRPTTVGSYEPNPFGLYDMHGNIEEWCFDPKSFHAYESRGDLTEDPVVTSESSSRETRGAAWDSSAIFGRSAARGLGSPDLRLSIRGFRIIRNPER